MTSVYPVLSLPNPQLKAGEMAKPQRKPKEKNFNIRFGNAAIERRIEETAHKLGLDPTSLLRMIVKENLKTYEARAAEIDDQGTNNGDGGTHG